MRTQLYATTDVYKSFIYVVTVLVCCEAAAWWYRSTIYAISSVFAKYRQFWQL